MSTAIITSNTSLNHNAAMPEHPERPERITAIIETLRKNKKLIWKKTKEFDKKILKATHTPKHIDKVNKAFPEKGLHFLDADTIISPGSKDASYDAVGSIITGIDGIESGEFNNFFACVRPPGHHATKDVSMGFCVFNSIACGATYLLNKYKYKKILILDFDIHMGNGTADIFYDNKNVCYISLHQYPFYPGVAGSEKNKGLYNNCLNIPLPAGTGSREYLDAFEHALKKIKEFKPNYILTSAGFDSFFQDPIGQFNLHSKDFYEITKRILNYAKKYCNGKIGSILEGGYDLSGTAESANEHVNALLEFN
jgi:acetoin utilization deacetylase AcuC-like enzyme